MAALTWLNDEQIHLFLSKALGFFERSGLNVTGGVNFDNVTAFEVPHPRCFAAAAIACTVELDDQIGGTSIGALALRTLWRFSYEVSGFCKSIIYFYSRKYLTINSSIYQEQSDVRWLEEFC